MIVVLLIGTCILWMFVYFFATNEYGKNELQKALKHFSLAALYSGFYLLQLKHTLYKPLSRKFLFLLWALTVLQTLLCILYICTYASPIFNIPKLHEALQDIASFINMDNYYNNTAQQLATRLIAAFTILIVALDAYFYLAHWHMLNRLKLRPKKNKKSRKWTK